MTNGNWSVDVKVLLNQEAAKRLIQQILAIAY